MLSSSSSRGNHIHFRQLQLRRALPFLVHVRHSNAVGPPVLSSVPCARLLISATKPPSSPTRVRVRVRVRASAPSHPARLLAGAVLRACACPEWPVPSPDTAAPTRPITAQRLAPPALGPHPETRDSRPENRAAPCHDSLATAEEGWVSLFTRPSSSCNCNTCPRPAPATYQTLTAQRCSAALR